MIDNPGQVEAQAAPASPQLTLPPMTSAPPFRSNVFGIAISTVAAAALAMHWADRHQAPTAAVSLVLAAVAIGVLPGGVISVLLLRDRTWTPFQFIGIGSAVSLALIQLVTIISLSAHVPATLFALLLPVGSLLAGVIGWPRLARLRWQVDREELWLAIPILIIAVLLYIKGSPFASGEDQTHIAILRRLALLAHPSLDNIYYSPGVLYTYPFPGIHYLMAMVADVSNLDALFTYHKLRFLWGMQSLVLVCLAARLAFANRGFRIAASATAVAFVFSGTFADMYGFYWAQLIPYSHVSDLAMNVVLPALIVATFAYFRASPGRDRLFFLSCMLGIVVMLTISHIREVIQFLVYVGALTAALLWVRAGRRWLMAAAAPLGCSVLIVLGYGLWQRYAIGHVDAVVNQRRGELMQLAKTLSPAGWVAAPFTDNRFSVAEQTTFSQWFPIVLLLAPLALFALRRSRLALLLGGSVLAYLLIIRFPLFAIPYVFITYFEILFTPVRNVVYFVYLLCGPILFLLALAIARLPRWWSRIATSLAVAAVLCVGERLGEPFWTAHQDVFWGPAIALYAVLFVALLPGWQRRVAAASAARRWVRNFRAWLASRRTPGRAGWVTFGVLLAAVAAGTFDPRSSPLALAAVNPNADPGLSRQSGKAFWTEAQITGSFSCLELERVRLPEPVQKANPTLLLHSCPPPPKLIAWANRSLPADAVLAINGFSAYATPEFLPQQIDAWPYIGSGGLYPEEIFPAYYKFFDPDVKNLGVQPMFNTMESLQDRLDFVSATGAAYVLVDPMYYTDLVKTFQQWPDHFIQLYNDEQWAVYNVRP
ncbi:MAG TPA: hypothetical protein VF157_10165 [Chloroflexota bacterium]